jgi:hypothetical protein
MVKLNKSKKRKEKQKFSYLKERMKIGANPSLSPQKNESQSEEKSKLP